MFGTICELLILGLPRGSESERKAMSAPGIVEKALAIVLLLLSTGAFLNLFLKHGKFMFESNAGLPFMQLIWAILYLFVLVFLIKEARGFGGLLLRGWPFLLLLAICLLSIIWSDAKGLTARRSVALVATTFTGFYLAIRYSFKAQLQLLVSLSKICIVLSLIFGTLHLGTAVDSRSGPMFGLYIQGNSRGILGFLFDILPIELVFGRLYEPWYGIFTQRNTLGIMMAFAAFVLYLWSRINPEEKWSAYLWASLSFLLLFLSGSLTGFLSLWVIVIGGVLLRNIRRHRQWARRILVASTVMAVLGIYYAASHPASVTSFFDRDVTLTGRTTIWGASLLLGMDHPWIGHGFNAFWLGDEGPSGEIRKLAGWDVPSAHNGYLEIWLDLGFCGLAAFFVGFALYFGESIRYFFRGEGWEGFWPVLYLAFLATINLAQSALVSPNYFFWILYVAISTRVCLANLKPATELGE
jgi:exopolysaccharide production protein ExoQ